MIETAVVKDLGSEEEVTELHEGSEHDKEHDEEANQVSPAPAQCSGQLRHGLEDGDDYIDEDEYHDEEHVEGL